MVKPNIKLTEITVLIFRIGAQLNSFRPTLQLPNHQRLAAQGYLSDMHMGFR